MVMASDFVELFEVRNQGRFIDNSQSVFSAARRIAGRIGRPELHGASTCELKPMLGFRFVDDDGRESDAGFAPRILESAVAGRPP
jgi:hypothetical protein